MGQSKNQEGLLKPFLNNNFYFYILFFLQYNVLYPYSLFDQNKANDTFK